MTESFKQQLQELVDQAAEKFDERNNQETDYYCPYSFKQGCELLIPVLMKAVEQRDDAIWNKFRSREQYAKVFFATDLADIMDKELLQLLKGDDEKK